MNIDCVQSIGHSPVSHTSTHILCILSVAVSPANLNNSAGTSSGPALFLLAVSLIARSTSDLSGAGSFMCSPSILHASSPSYNSSQYSFHLSATSSLFVISSSVFDFTQINCRILIIYINIRNTCAHYICKTLVHNYYYYYYYCRKSLDMYITYREILVISSLFLYY